MMPDIESVVAQSRSGDAIAFGRLAAEIRGMVYRWAVDFSGDPDDAEDIAQVVLMKLHGQLGGFRRECAFPTWLFRVTRNVASDHKVKTARRRAILQRRSLGGTWTSPGLAEVEEEIVAPPLAAALTECLDRLPARQREVFLLAVVHELSVSQIAAQLGTQCVTARVTLWKARRAVRSHMTMLMPGLQ